MKTIITNDEYLMLVGLFTLAKEHMKRIRDCQYAASKILTVAPQHESATRTVNEHVTDEIFGRECDFSDFIRRYGIEVE